MDQLSTRFFETTILYFAASATTIASPNQTPGEVRPGDRQIRMINAPNSLQWELPSDLVCPCLLSVRDDIGHHHSGETQDPTALYFNIHKHGNVRPGGRYAHQLITASKMSIESAKAAVEWGNEQELEELGSIIPRMAGYKVGEFRISNTLFTGVRNEP